MVNPKILFFKSIMVHFRVMRQFVVKHSTRAVLIIVCVALLSSVGAMQYMARSSQVKEGTSPFRVTPIDASVYGAAVNSSTSVVAKGLEQSKTGLFNGFLYFGDESHAGVYQSIPVVNSVVYVPCDFNFDNSMVACKEMTKRVEILDVISVYEDHVAALPLNHVVLLRVKQKGNEQLILTQARTTGWAKGDEPSSPPTIAFSGFRILELPLLDYKHGVFETIKSDGHLSWRVVLDFDGSHRILVDMINYHHYGLGLTRNIIVDGARSYSDTVNIDTVSRMVSFGLPPEYSVATLYDDVRSYTG